MTSAVPVLGIDFGTTNTAAAWVDAQKQLQMVPITPTTSTMPSVVHVRKNGRAIVGRSALEQLLEAPERTFYGIKRFLGRRYRSEFVTRNQHRFPFPIVEGKGGLCATVIDEQEVSLSALARHIVGRIVELANAAAGVTFEKCVVAVPAHFTQRQRQLVREVVQQVLEVKAIVNEPTAAAIAFAHHERNKDFRDIFVYDLGGGTFDTTFLRVNQNLVEVLATGGDAFLGGSDFDSKIVDLLCEHLENKYQLNVRENHIVMQRLSIAAEQAKIAVSSHEHADMRVPFVGQVGDKIIDLNVRIQRRDVENLCAPLVEKTIGICEKIRSDAEPADAFIFVGGQTKMPALRKRLAQIFPVANTTLDPECAVAAGAAWVGSGAHALLDVLSVPVGIMVAGAAPMEALPRHTPVPVTRRIPIPRSPEGQPLSIAVFQALDTSSVERDLMGVVRVDNEWLNDNPGDLTLEVRMTAAFDLMLLLHSPMGARLPLEFDARQQMRSTPNESTALPTTSRAFDMPTETVTFGIKDPSGAIRWYEAEEVRSGLVFVATSTPLQVNTNVEIGLMLPSRPARLFGKVSASLSTCSGMNIEFALPDEYAADYQAFRAQAQKVDRSEQSDSEALTQFLNGIEAKNAYSALGIPAVATPAEVRRAIGAIRGVLARQRSRWPESLKGRLEKLESLLDNTARILLGGYTRLVHDFRLGRVMAAQRLRGATPRQIEVMQRAWKKVHPDLVLKAQQNIQQARSAHGQGNIDGARHLVNDALRYDPFNTEIHRLVAAL